VKFIENIEDLYSIIREGKNENLFRNKMIDLEIYPVDVAAKVQTIFLSSKKNAISNVRMISLENENRISKESNNLNNKKSLDMISINKDGINIEMENRNSNNNLENLNNIDNNDDHIVIVQDTNNDAFL
jgi:hypothetical protein